MLHLNGIDVDVVLDFSKTLLLTARHGNVGEELHRLSLPLDATIVLDGLPQALLLVSERARDEVSLDLTSLRTDKNPNVLILGLDGAGLRHACATSDSLLRLNE